ncbi:MAG TPA: hypothetical protein VFQ35_28475 [Polyangiaceae bacterium]|nr:hypothetical protein [Polyangiaceae bacterium]
MDNPLEQFQQARARQDLEWERVFAALQELDPALTFLVQRSALDELEKCFESRPVHIPSVTALRA